jgi:uncharacterized protein (TIGR01777 family)
MNILLTGATGLIGSALLNYFQSCGHKVYPLTRYPREDQDIGWNPDSGQLNLTQLQDLDAVVHLAGESITGGLWTPKRKKKILNSRVEGTRLLCSKLTELDRPPRILLSASGIHHYPFMGGGEFDELGPAGEGFLYEVCKSWEKMTELAGEKGIRVVNLRFSLVLSPKGGALALMLPAFKYGLGGRLGRGQQYMSWVAIDDVVDIIDRCLLDDQLTGPVNVCAPESVTNTDFTRILGEVLRRPTLLPLPEIVVKTLFGQMGRETLLADFRIAPRKLLERKYTFKYPSLQPALSHLLDR